MESGNDKRPASIAMLRYTLFILCSSFIYFCSNQAGLTANEKVKITREIRQTLKDYNEAMKKNALSADYKYLDNSDQFFWMPPGYLSALSHDSVMAIVKNNASVLKSIVESFDTVTIYPLTRDLAAYTGRIHSVITDSSGKVAEFHLWETAIVVKRNDGWKLLSGQTSFLNN